MILIDKKSLFDEVSMGKLKLCVKTKTITIYANGVGLTFLRKIRDVGQGAQSGYSHHPRVG